MDVIAPAQHEVHQKRDERSHQHHLIHRAQVGDNVVGSYVPILVNTDFLNCGGVGGYRTRCRGPRASPGSRDRGRLGGLGLAGSGEYPAKGLLCSIQPIHHRIDQTVNPALQGGGVFSQFSHLAIGGKTQQIDKHGRHQTNQQRTQRPGHPHSRAHSDEGLQNQGGDGGNQRGYEDHSSPVEQRN